MRQIDAMRGTVAFWGCEDDFHHKGTKDTKKAR
jgi:hypothetical protein